MPRILRGYAERGLGAECAAKMLGGARREGSGWKCLCPAHDDRKPSLHISDADNGGLLVNCKARCSQDKVISALRARGIDVSPPEETAQAASKSARPTADHNRSNDDGWTLIVPVPEDAPARLSMVHR